jgi:hypothetical protein
LHQKGEPFWVKLPPLWSTGGCQLPNTASIVILITAPDFSLCIYTFAEFADLIKAIVSANFAHDFIMQTIISRNDLLYAPQDYQYMRKNMMKCLQAETAKRSSHIL